MKYRREPKFQNFGCRKKEGDGRSLDEKMLDFLPTPTLLGNQHNEKTIPLCTRTTLNISAVELFISFHYENFW